MSKSKQGSPFIFLVFLILSISCAQKNTTPTSDMTIGEINPVHVGLTGAECTFSEGGKTVLVLDWVDKAWMTIDGKQEEFHAEKKAGSEKKWEQEFQSEKITLKINLVITAQGQDTASMQGEIALEKDAKVKKLNVKGGCGA